MNWYYAEAGKQTGPIADEPFIELVRTGAVNDDTLVWHDGLTDWVPYRQLKDPQPGTAATFPAVREMSGTKAICAECKKTFPVDEMIRHGNSYICAACKPVFMQKLAEGATTTDMNYAGFWIRFAAKFLDGLILGVVVVAPIMIALFVFGFAAARNAATLHAFNPGPEAQISALPMAANFVGLFFQLGFLVVSVIYSAIFLGKYGATPGKMLCGLKVVTADGGKITYARGLGRGCAEILSRLICLIGYIIAAFDDQKRTLHDHICNTRVVYK